MNKEKDFLPKWLRTVLIIIIIVGISIKLLELLIKHFGLNVHLP